MSIEDRYLSGLIAVQYPEPTDPTSMDGVQLAAGPSDTVSDAGGGVRVGRAGVPYRAPSMRDITEPAGALLDMGAATLKGGVQGFVGLPGDLESIGRLVLEKMGVGVNQNTVLPKTDDVKKWLDTNVGQVGNGQNPYESIGEVTAPGGQIKAVKAAGRGAKALAPKAGEMVLQSMDKLGSPVKIDLMAYHGTPHKVDKFDSARIGSGEGNQAFGYGLYFAENPKVANDYRFIEREWFDTSKATYKGKSIDQHYDMALKDQDRAQRTKNTALLSEANARLSFWESVMTHSHPEQIINDAIDNKADWPELTKYVQSIDLKGFKGIPKPGNLYTVDIPDDMVGKMLEWDKPLSEQPEAVKAFLASVPNPPSEGQPVGEWLKPRLKEGAAPYWSEDMRKAGIPGIRYFDAGSRDAGNGTRNIVVFPGEEDKVKIVKHNGNDVEKPSSDRGLGIVEPDGLTANGAKLTSDLEVPAAGDITKPAFKKWFGDSKAVDTSGKPIVLYHGSPDARDLKSDDAVFSTFKERMAKYGSTPESLKAAREQRAYFFSDKRSVANTYADDRRAFDYQNAEAGVVPVYVSLKNPLIVDAKGLHWREAQTSISKDDFVVQAKKDGYDGVIIRNVRDNYDSMQGGKDPVSNVYVAFAPEQIKSVFNKGTWNPNDPRILHGAGAGTAGTAATMQDKENN